MKHVKLFEQFLIEAELVWNPDFIALGDKEFNKLRRQDSSYSYKKKITKDDLKKLRKGKEFDPEEDKFLIIKENEYMEHPTPVGNTQSSKQYIYHIFNNSDEDFKADVRDPDGKIILEINSSVFSNEGHMKNKEDLTGLQQLLLSKNKIKPGDQVVFAKDVKSEMDANDFTPPLNVNNTI